MAPELVETLYTQMEIGFFRRAKALVIANVSFAAFGYWSMGCWW
jgi:hypothetical protein